MWDALIDNEFSASCSGANPASNANIAIYLDTSNRLTKLGLASSNPFPSTASSGTRCTSGTSRPEPQPECQRDRDGQQHAHREPDGHQHPGPDR
jgi:hypothetical protein